MHKLCCIRRELRVCTKKFFIGLLFARGWDGGGFLFFFVFVELAYDTPEGGVHRDSGLRMDGISIGVRGLEGYLIIHCL